MPNLNYIKGRNKEYSIMRLLREEGFDIVFRSAGSHSPIDVIGINSHLKTIRLIQCKPNSFSQRQKEDLEQELSWINNAFRCEFEVI